MFDHNMRFYTSWLLQHHNSMLAPARRSLTGSFASIMCLCHMLLLRWHPALPFPVCSRLQASVHCTVLNPCRHKLCLLFDVLVSGWDSIAALQFPVFVCLQAGAYRTILTHFSQRYPKIPKIDASFSSSTCIAFDLMSVNLAGGPTCSAVAAKGASA